MKILLKFDPSKGYQGVKQAVRLLRSWGYTIDTSLDSYELSFDKPTRRLERLLLNLVNISSKQIFIDDKPVEFDIIWDILFCDYKRRCTGICGKIKLGYYSLIELSEKDFAFISDKGEFFVSDDFVESMSIFLEKKGGSIYFPNKELMIKTIKQDYSLIINLCNKLKKDEIVNVVSSLPAEIIEIDWSELESMKDIEERRIQEDIERRIQEDIERRIQEETEESIMQKEIEEIHRCMFRYNCDGVCMLLEFADLKIDKYLTKCVNKNGYGELWEDEASRYSNFFLKCEIEDKENILVRLDKNKLTEFYIDKYRTIFENCTILNKEKTLEKTKQLPGILKIVDENELFYENSVIDINTEENEKDY